MNSRHLLNRCGDLLLIEDDVFLGILFDIERLHVMILKVLGVIPVMLITFQNIRQNVQISLLLSLFILLKKVQDSLLCFLNIEKILTTILGAM